MKISTTTTTTTNKIPPLSKSNFTVTYSFNAIVCFSKHSIHLYASGRDVVDKNY